jgi:hypothetical protein
MYIVVDNEQDTDAIENDALWESLFNYESNLSSVFSSARFLLSTILFSGKWTKQLLNAQSNDLLTSQTIIN